MIDSASNYKEMDVSTLSGFISGGIFPVRKKKIDGSWRRLKYEDLLFLKEGKLERKKWKDYTERQELASAPGRIFSKSAFDQLFLDPEDLIHSGGQEYFFYDSFIKCEDELQETYSFSGFSTSTDILKTPDVEDFRFSTDVTSVVSPKKSRLESAFGNVEKMKRTFLCDRNTVQPLKNEGIGTFRVNGTKWEKYGTSIFDIYSYYFGGDTDGGNHISYSTEYKQYANNVWSIFLPYANNVLLYAIVQYGISSNITSFLVRIDECNVSAVEGEEASGKIDGCKKITFGSSFDGLGIIRSLASSKGLVFYEPDAYIPDGIQVSYGLYPFALIIENEFPATPPDDE